MPDRIQPLPPPNWDDYQLVQDYMTLAAEPGIYGLNPETGNVDVITHPSALLNHRPVLYTNLSFLINLRAQCRTNLRDAGIIRRTVEIEEMMGRWERVLRERNDSLIRGVPAAPPAYLPVEALQQVPYAPDPPVWLREMVDQLNAPAMDTPKDKAKEKKKPRPAITRHFSLLDVAREIAKVYTAQERVGIDDPDYFWSSVKSLHSRFCNRPQEWAEWVRSQRRNATTGPVDALTRALNTRLIRDLQNPMLSRSVPPGEGIGIELEFLRARHREGQEMPTLDLPGVFWGWDISTRVFPEDVPQVHQPPTNEVRLFQKFGRWRRLEEVCRFLRAEHCTAYPTCGLHIHLDQRHLDVVPAKERYFRLRQSIHWLSDMAPLYRKATNYAKVNPGKRMSHDRYVAVNWESYEEHRTIEVRFHSSSLDPRKIIEFVRVLLFVQDCPKKLLTLEQFLGSDAPRDIKLWVLGRTMLMDPDQHAAVRRMAAELVKDTDPRAEKFLTAGQIERIKAIVPNRRRH